ncbi:MAG: phosphopentomutase [Sporomusaceae bacterium]|nr:phosphopentomutase [Sporomusaceae bacterium]
MFKRIIIIILDSVGVGALPDAQKYGDETANTLAHVARAAGGLSLPVLEKLGLGLIEPGALTPRGKALACYGKMQELSRGKDTVSGHWEIACCPVIEPFPVYPGGFPAEVIKKFQLHTAVKGVLGNKAASGTEIIAELGAEHLQTGFPIVYTSADSVFQIAAHEEIIPLNKLYELCRIAREEVCVGKHAVGRIIARPFLGEPGSFIRTANRHDYSLAPIGKTMLDVLTEAGFTTTGIGKINDIFAGRGIGNSLPTKSNEDGMRQLAAYFTEMKKSEKQGLVMVNLVEFDSHYGHRNDVPGYAQALREFDAQLEKFLPLVGRDDLLIITADHGCDPTTPGTDHTREYVPLLAYSPQKAAGSDLGVRKSFADVGATVLDNFALPGLGVGTSFLPVLREN